MDTDRPRDEQGRARNDRPRDGLGRPLPRGTTGVARQPEGVVRTAEETLAEAQALLADRKPFHAHEVFEDAWKSGPADERGLWKGMAQLAVGVTHAARGNRTGAVTLLRRGATNIEAFATTPPHGIAVAALVRWAREHAAGIEATPEAGPEWLPVPRLR